MPKHGAINLYLQAAQDVHLDSHTAPELCQLVHDESDFIVTGSHVKSDMRMRLVRFLHSGTYVVSLALSRVHFSATLFCRSSSLFSLSLSLGFLFSISSFVCFFSCFLQPLNTTNEKAAKSTLVKHCGYQLDRVDHTVLSTPRTADLPSRRAAQLIVHFINDW